MRSSFLFSLSLHAGVVLAGMVALPQTETFEVDKVESMPVDLVTVDEFNKLKAQTKAPEPEKEPEPQKAEPKPAEPAPAPEPKEVAALPPKPEPEPEPAPPEPEPAPKAKPEPKPEPKAKAAPPPMPRRKPRRIRRMKTVTKKTKFDADKIAALLNKIPDQGARPPDSAGLRPAAGAFDVARGNDSVMTMDEVSWLRAQIERCWNPPVGLADAQNLVVRLQINLNADGSLRHAPIVVNSDPNEYFRVAADSAVRAVQRCQPFRMPPEKYDAWREIILNFDPKAMFRG